jgi:predicted phosphodiesterase
MKTININFTNENIAPYKANSIGLFNKNNELVGTININQIKPEYGNRLYRFGLLSDVHNQNDISAEPDTDFQNALKFFNSNDNVIFTCICGDITENGTEEELQKYKNNINEKSPNTVVYTCTGNHDAQNQVNNISGLWKKYTGCDKNFSFVYNNDAFIFLSMARWSIGPNGVPYNDIDIDWLTEQLNLYRNVRTFIFTHLFFPDLSGNFKQIYPSSNWLGGEQLNKLSKLRKHFINSIWFNGHSHWKWYLQQYQNNANIDHDGGWTVHIPSCASPIDSKFVGNGQGYANKDWTRESKKLDSEGAIIDVYDNYIDIRGIVFKEGTSEYTNKYSSIATYRLDTKIKNIEEYKIIGKEYDNINNVRYINSSDILPNNTKDGSENIEISDLPDNYILLKFNDIKTGVVIAGDNSENAKYVKLIVEDIQISHDNKTYSNIIPDNFGFYTKYNNYTVENCEGELVLDNLSNTNRTEVQFNVSSRYVDELPIYCKIKFKLLYSNNIGYIDENNVINIFDTSLSLDGCNFIYMNNDTELEQYLPLSYECFTNFNEHNIIPNEVNKIKVINGDNFIGIINIQNTTNINSELIYSVGLVSDIHYNDNDDNYSDINIYNETGSQYAKDFKNMSEFFNNNNVDMVCCSGDVTTNEENHSKNFKVAKEQLLENNNILFYSCKGNHDNALIYHSNSPKSNKEHWIENCTSVSKLINNLNDNKLIKYVRYFDNNLNDVGNVNSDIYDETSFYFETNNGDVFIFLDVDYNFNSATPNESTNYQYYNETTLNTFADILEQYKNNRCFVFTHLFFKHKAGTIRNENYYEYHVAQYNYSLQDNNTFTQFSILNELNNKYTNTIWFTGHSHYPWYSQKHDRYVNICNKDRSFYENDNNRLIFDNKSEKTSGYNIHLPSLSDPLALNKDHHYRETDPGRSEGAIMKIYNNYIDIYGITFKRSEDIEYINKYEPISIYRIYL